MITFDVVNGQRVANLPEGRLWLTKVNGMWQGLFRDRSRSGGGIVMGTWPARSVKAAERALTEEFRAMFRPLELAMMTCPA